MKRIMAIMSSLLFCLASQSFAQTPGAATGDAPSEAQALGAAIITTGDVAGLPRLAGLAENGDARAAFLMGMLCHERKACRGRSALEWIQICAEAGDTSCLVAKGWLIRDAGDLAGAFDCFRRAAETGDPEALYAKGMALGKGEGVARDAQQAADHLRMAAASGHDEAALAYAGACLGGNMASCAREDARGVLERTARKNGPLSPKALLLLAAMHAGKTGGEENRILAAEFYCKAAETGEPEGMRECALRLNDGDGAERDKERAAELFERAARGGDARSAKELAMLHVTGEGVERNEPLAHAWFTMAAKLDREYEGIRARHAVMLTSQERDKAAELFAGFSTK